MDKTKQTLVIALVAVLAVFGVGWQFFVAPQRSNVSSLNAQKTTQDANNEALQTKISQLKSELVELPQAQAALAAVARRLPANLAEVSLIQSLTRAAAEANVDLQVITPGAPTLANSTSSVSVTVAPTTSGSASATTSAAAVAPAAGGAAVGGAPSASGNQLYAIPLSLTVSGDYFDLEMFIHNLEGMQRAVLVNTISLVGTGGLTVTPTATATAGSAAGAGTAVKNGSTTKTSAKSATSGKTVKAVKPVKPVPGSVAAAQAEANSIVRPVTDGNSLALTVNADVFSMYTSAPLPVSVTAAPTPTSSPTK